MEYVIQFILFFIIIFLYYYFIATKRFKAKYRQKGDKMKKKVNYKKLLKQITFMFSIVLPITVLTTFFVKSIFLKILIGFVLLIGLTYFGFYIIRVYYKKRGMVKDV